MRYQGLYILLACHGLEDFPVYQKGDEAASLLANWTALWHPALIHAAGSAPTWARIDDPPDSVAEKLLLVPLSNQNDLQTGFAQRVENEGGRLIRGKIDRNEIVKLALQDLVGNEENPQALPVIDDDVVRDFYALGYCFLQIQMLTRHMRYSSNLDEVFFKKQLVAAANAAAGVTATESAAAAETDETTAAANPGSAREILATCFDILAEERNHFYPVDAFLIDVTLVADTTLGKTLQRQLEHPHQQNLMITAHDVEQLQQKNEAAFAQLQKAVADNRLEIVGGNYQEIAFPLMSQETIFRQFKRSLDIYRNLLGKSPTVFARRRFGLSPALPQILEQFGFKGAIHVTLDEGKFPEGLQSKTRWEGAGDAAIDALAKIPLEIDKPESFLNLGIKLGEAMDMDHLAVIWFAHWPDQSCDSFEDLTRIRKYCNALGKFVTLSEFFAQTDSPLHSDRFGADQYRSPFLKQAVMKRAHDPISRGARFWRRQSKLDAINALNFLAAVTQHRSAKQNLAESQAPPPAGISPANMLELGQEIDHAFEAQLADSDYEEGGEQVIHDIDRQLDQQFTAAKSRIESAIPRETSDQSSGYLVVNPSSFIRRINVDVSELTALPDVEKPVYAADSDGSRKLAVVDVPPMGFAWLAAGNSSKTGDKQLNLADEHLLRNEFMELVIDEKSGGLRAIHDYKARKNRLSAKLALRYPLEGEPIGKQDWVYSEMVADSVAATIASTALGEFVVKGKLVAEKKIVLAEFKMTYRLWRGSRVAEIDVEIDPQRDLLSDPWNSYFGIRFAWNDESADLWRSVQQSRQRVAHNRFESAHYLELETPNHRTTIFSGGLTFFHQRGLRMIDLPLITRGENARKFTFGIGIDVTHPMHQAMAMLAPPVTIKTTGKPKPDHCWLFHIDSKNVIATWWEPIEKENRAVGFRVRLLETMGRNSTFQLSAFRPLKSAQRINFLGEAKHDCEIVDDKFSYDLAAHQYVEIEAFW